MLSAIGAGAGNVSEGYYWIETEKCGRGGNRYGRHLRQAACRSQQRTGVRPRQRIPELEPSVHR